MSASRCLLHLLLGTLLLLAAACWPGDPPPEEPVDENPGSEEVKGTEKPSEQPPQDVAAAAPPPRIDGPGPADVAEAAPPPEDTAAAAPPPEDVAASPDPFEAWWDSLQEENLLFNVPPAREGQTARVRLVVRKGATVEALDVHFDAMNTQPGHEAAGVRESERAKMSRTMSAQLTHRSKSAAIEIEPQTPGEQVIRRDRPTTWEWKVTPHEPGEHRLDLEMYAIYEQGRTSVRTFHEVLSVEADRKGRLVKSFRENWEWVWTLLLVPAVAWIQKRRRGRGDSQADREEV